MTSKAISDVFNQIHSRLLFLSPLHGRRELYPPETMSSEVSESTIDSTHAQTPPDTSVPTLTVVATGPTTFTRQVSADETASILAEHDSVTLHIEREVRSADAFETVIDPTFRGSGPTVCKSVIVDDLLTDHAMEGYQRDGDIDDWSLALTGTAPNWKQMSLDLVPDLHRCDSDEAAAVTRLWKLAADDVTNDGAVLAALDLVDQHEIETKRERLTELLAEG